MKNAITIYEPQMRARLGMAQVWVSMLKNVIRSRDLLVQLFRRDFFAVYKKSLMGRTWIFISPVLGIVSWVLMNSAGVLQPGDVGIPYPAYVLISTSIWGLFMGFYESSSETLNSGAGFIQQVNFPHEVLLFKQTAQHLAVFILSFIVNIAVLFAFQVIPSWKIVFFPLMALPMFFLGGGIGLVISALSVAAEDIKKGFKILMTLLMYVTPVIYAPGTGGELLQKVIKWNPLTYLVGEARNVIIYGKLENPVFYSASCLLAFIIFMLSWRFFFIAEEKVIEKMV